MATLVQALETSGVPDEPLQIVRTTPAGFPDALAMQGVTGGEVRVVINIDADGLLVDWLVTAYSHPQFAEAAIASLKEWSYKPARRKGELTGVRTELSFAFEAKGNVVSLTPGDAIAAFIERASGTRTIRRLCRAQDLDEPLRALHVANPMHPGAAMRNIPPSGTARLDFFVDEEGRPRMPVVLHADHIAFAQAAVGALEQWRFSPPRRDGAPVLARVQQEFVFKPRDALRARGG